MGVTALAMVAVAARAPEGEEQAAHGFLGVPTIAWQVANLSLFLVLLWVLLKKPLGRFFGDRRREVEDANRKAEADRRRAEELAREIDVRLSGIEVEIARLRTHAVEESEAEQKQLLAEAEADAARIVARGSNEIETRVREARKELTAFAADLAVEMADEILRKSVTPEDQARLVKEGTEALLSLAAPGRKR
ncbi:MAG TPA: ATP synthase F0 subunit B [Thermoanaerobaculia bacterium]|nr:ATP synthase F0 subunit B [Thermoanaerobaculia bacterium]